MKTGRDKKQLNGKEGTATMREAWDPPTMATTEKSPLKETQEA